MSNKFFSHNGLLKLAVTSALLTGTTTAFAEPAMSEVVVKIEQPATPAVTLPGEREYDQYMRLGYSAMKAGNPEMASLYFRNALYAVPKDREATIAFWNAQDRMKETAAAEDGAYDRYMNIGYDATEQADYQTALINFQRALERRPMDYYATQALRNVNTYIERGQDPASPQNVDAEATFYVGEAPYDRYMRLGYAAVQREDYRSAASQFRNALMLRPSDRQATIAYWNAVDGLKDGDYGLGSDGQEPVYDRYMRLGYDATEEKRYRQAIAFFKEALEIRPNDPYANQAIRNLESYIQGQSG